MLEDSAGDLSPGLEMPNPLAVEICRGDVSIETVWIDIMAQTKLNFNACLFADGSPITLKSANAVGEILATGQNQPGGAPLPFKIEARRWIP